jgi:hypothetical protein
MQLSLIIITVIDGLKCYYNLYIILLRDYFFIIYNNYADTVTSLSGKCIPDCQ